MDERQKIGDSLKRYLDEVGANLTSFIVILTLSHGDEVSVKMGQFQRFIPGGEGGILIQRPNQRSGDSTTSISGDKIVAVYVGPQDHVEDFVASAINHGNKDFMMVRMHGWKHPRNARICWMFQPVEA